MDLTSERLFDVFDSLGYHVALFDRDWRDRATDRQTVAMTAVTSEARGAVASVLHLKPGRYELRVAAAPAPR